MKTTLSAFFVLATQWTLLAQSNLNSNFEGYYPLNGTLSTNLSDANAIRPFKNATFTEDRNNANSSALYISAVSQGIDLPDISMLPATRFTLMLWVYASKAQFVNNFFAQNTNCVPPNSEVKDPICLFPIFNFSTQKNYLPAQEWFFMTITYKDGQTSVFVNDEAKPRIQHRYHDFDKLNTTIDVGFGFLDSETEKEKISFVGAVDDIRLLNRIISVAEKDEFFKNSQLPTTAQSAQTETPKNNKIAQQPNQQPTEQKNNSTPKEDKIAPRIEFTSKTRDLGITALNSNTIEISGAIIDQSPILYLSVDGQSIMLTSENEFKSTFKETITLKNGQSSLEFEAVDVHNNLSKQVLQLKPNTANNNNSNNAEIALSNQTVEAIEKSKYHALFIAVADYEEEHLILDNTVKDAQKVQSELMANYGFEPDQITFLEDPDEEEITEAFAELQNSLTSNDNLFIFYAGHGHWDETLGKSYWLPADAEHDTQKKTHWISTSDIADNLKLMKTQHILLVTDACFSGGLLKSRDIEDDHKAYDAMFGKTSRRAITSGDLETVPDKSVFIQYFIKALRDNKQHYCFSSDLFSDFRKAVIANSPQKQRPQTGVIQQSGDEGGDFIFRRNP